MENIRVDIACKDTGEDKTAIGYEDYTCDISLNQSLLNQINFINIFLFLLIIIYVGST